MNKRLLEYVNTLKTDVNILYIGNADAYLNLSVKNNEKVKITAVVDNFDTSSYLSSISETVYTYTNDEYLDILLSLDKYRYDIVYISELVVEKIIDFIIYSHRLCKEYCYIFIDNQDNDDVKVAITRSSSIMKTSSIEDVYLYNFLYQPSTPNITIVTALYDIRKYENGDQQGLRTMDKYIELGSKIYSDLDVPMVIYTEDTLYDKVKEMRKKYMDKTVIVVEEFKDTDYYTYVDRLKEVMEKSPLNNDFKVKDTCLYTLLCCNKFYWVKRSIQENVFKSDHFIWADIGICHCSVNTKMVKLLAENVSDKIRHMRISKPRNLSFEYFKTIWHNVAGSTFSGNRDNMLLYCDLFKNKWEQLLSQDFWQLDEQVMAMIAEENEELFSPYFGDYSALISNYHRPHNNIDFLLQESQRELDLYRHKTAYEILLFLSERLMYHSVYHERWLTKFLVAYWYVEGDVLSDAIVGCIKYAKWKNPSYTDNIKSILDFYKNDLSELYD